MKQYDIVIIGAGIHGVTCARSAAEHGFSCLLLEQFAEAAKGTSGRSSKLIHGGLRYLETLQFRLVRECLTERARLLNDLPELVKLIPFYIPVYRFSKRRPWQIRLGLTLYQLLGGEAFRSIPKSDWSGLDGLITDDLLAVFQYWDAQTDDVMLTHTVLESAQALGVEVIMNAQFEQAQRDPGCYRLVYQIGGQVHACRTRMIINAAGPWVNHVLDRIKPDPSRREIELVAGTHIVLPDTLHHGIYYLEARSDRRAVFVQSWKEHSLVGTTEKIYQGPPEDVQPTQEEIEYLLDIYNYYFNKQLRQSDIIESYAGLRVLPKSDRSPFYRPRETVIHPDKAGSPRLFTIYGGKLTSHQATAETVIKRVMPVLKNNV